MTPEIEYTQMPQALVPIDTPLSIIHKHIPRQSDIDKIVKNIETHVIHSLELPIQAQDLIPQLFVSRTSRSIPYSDDH